MNTEELLKNIKTSERIVVSDNGLIDELHLMTDGFKFSLDNNGCLSIESKSDVSLPVEVINKIHNYMIQEYEITLNSNKYDWYQFYRT